jgi:heme exporter protein D
MAATIDFVLMYDWIEVRTIEFVWLTYAVAVVVLVVYETLCSGQDQ